MDRKFILVVYDISRDRRRTKLHNRLKDFGSPVQYSVFECLLTGDEITAMKGSVRKIIKPRLDRVRYYPMCNRCLKGIDITSGPEVLHQAEVTVV